LNKSGVVRASTSRIEAGGRFALILALLLYGAMLTTTLTLWLVYAADQSSVLSYAHERDFLNPYIGVRLLLTGNGGRIYDLALQAAVSRAAVAPFAPGQLSFLYPPYTALMLSPLGLFSYPTAFLIWYALNVCIAGYAIFRLLNFARPERAERAPLLLAALGFAPLFHTLWQGQVSVVVLLSLTQAALALRAGRDLQGGAWLFLGMIKPQLIVVPLLALVVMRRWRALLIFGVAAGTLHLLTLLFFGNWLPDYLVTLRGSIIDHEISENIALAMPDYRGLVFLLLGTNNGLLAVGAELALSGVSLLATAAFCRMRNGVPWEARFALAALVGLLVIPHLLIHDAVIALAPGFLLWRVSRRDPEGPSRADRYLLRVTLALGPLVFYAMQIWHPPLFQIGAWYLALLAGAVLKVWRFPSRLEGRANPTAASPGPPSSPTSAGHGPRDVGS
jgi:hypothetical protein